MASQRITWITLPDGFTAPGGAGRARLSVLVSPQLQPDAAEVLAPFDFVDWPARLASGAVSFEVGFGEARTGTRTGAEIVSRPESRLWQALFDAQTFVRPHEPDVTSPVFGSYPAARMHGLLKAGYRETATESPLDAGVRTAAPAAFAEIRELLAPAATEAEGDDPALGARERRVRLVRQLFRPGSAEQLTQRLELLASLALSESARNLPEDGDAFIPIVPDTGDVASTLAQFMVYHRQPGGARTEVDARPGDPRVDFHQRLTALSAYPRLLRLLGLVIDLEVDPDAIPEATPAAAGLVRVFPSFTSPASVSTTFLTPPTAYVLEPGQVFTAAPAQPGDRTQETVSGFLNLHLPATPDPDSGVSEDQFQIVQVDVDGGGLRLLDLLGRVPPDGADPSDGLALPPLRSGGVSITRHGNAPLLHGALSTGRRKMAALAAGEPTVLFAEDLVRGFRVDVGDPAAGGWHTLHQREGTYRFLATQEERQIGDEGCVEPTLVQPVAPEADAGPAAPDPSAPNYVTESLFLWQGWSLAAPRTGELLPQPETPTNDAPEPAKPAGDTIGLEVSFRPRPRSLPRLRFGQRYRLRVRLADLAGNGLDLEEADRLTGALAERAPVLPRPAGGRGPGAGEFRFLRFEVVPSPLVVPRAEGQNGESTERIVLRSNHDLTPAAFAALHAATHPEYALTPERHVAPPRTWQLLAELSGRFDAAFGTDADPDRLYDLAAREEGPEKDDAVHPEATMAVDWLPDPLAAGVSFRGLPGAPEGTVGRANGTRLEFTALRLPPARSKQTGPVVTVGFGPASAWPDLSPFRLRLAEGAEPPAWDAAERVLTVFLPKGERRTVRVSCLLQDEAALKLLGIWEWMVEELHNQAEHGRLPEADLPGRLEELRQLSLLGLSRMLTPYRELTLVHAVQQPVEAPVILSLAPARLAGTTFVHPRGRVRVHAASTGTVELTARWTEKVDDPQQPGPDDVDFEAQVFAAPFPVPDPNDADPPAPPPAAGTVPEAVFDAAAGVVEFLGPAVEALTQDVAAASARLGKASARLRQAALQAGISGGETVYDSAVAELFTLTGPPVSGQRWQELAAAARALETRIQQDLADFNPADLPPDVPPTPDSLIMPIGFLGIAAGQLAAAADAALAELRSFRGRQEFGDTRHRRVCYEVVATTRFGECFDDDLDHTRPSECATVDVPSSAPPAPPGVQYIVPAFSWARTGTAPGSDTLTSQRRGGGLRVYLDRPWFSSGDGELLGVVVASAPEFEEFLRRGEATVTQVGRDPQWVSPRTRTLPTPEDFRNVAVSRPLGPPVALTTVLGFGVEFDRQGRCFCDIELTPRDAYYPFVRLALVRLQPHSVPGTELSRSVLADFAQLVPDRGVTVVRRADHDFAVTVTGRTHQSPTSPSEPGGRGTRVRVSVQERIPGTTDDAGWLPAGGGAVVTPETAVPTGAVLWNGTVSLPATRAQGRFRVLVQELETYRSLDPLSSVPSTVLVDRVVFAEAVVL